MVRHRSGAAIAVLLDLDIDAKGRVFEHPFRTSASLVQGDRHDWASDQQKRGRQEGLMARQVLNALSQGLEEVEMRISGCAVFFPAPIRCSNSLDRTWQLVQKAIHDDGMT
eukprot:c20713_g3_i1.p2 GENE.c20713_g3_i1~~c20713_g3_i1.p2  ORF type:complete len:111 (-),score=11.95 c20713_g3_i1:172-504(-)